MTNICCISPLHESKPHFVDTRKKWLHGPAAEFGAVISNFPSKAHCSLWVQVFDPVLALLVPLRQHKQVHILASTFDVAVNLASDANLKVFRKFPDLVHVTDPSHDLVLILNEGVLFIKRLTCLRLGEVYVVVAGTGCFLHQLTHTVDTIFI